MAETDKLKNGYERFYLVKAVSLVGLARIEKVI
jgi:hypothetical protein